MNWRFLLHISWLCICIINSLPVRAGTTTLESGNMVNANFIFLSEVMVEDARPSMGLVISFAGIGYGDIHIEINQCLSNKGDVKITPYGAIAKVEVNPPDNNFLSGHLSVHCLGHISLPSNTSLLISQNDGTGIGEINSNMKMTYQIGRVKGGTSGGQSLVGKATDFADATDRGIHRLFYPESLLLESGEQNIETLLRYTCDQGTCTGMEVEIGTTGGIVSQDINITYGGNTVANGYVRMRPGTELNVANKSKKIGRKDGNITLNVSVY